jgi:hypothetical protein
VPSDDVSAVPLTSLAGDTRPIEEWTTTFQLALVVLDPYTQESAALLETAGRILRHYAEADCRTAFLMTCDEADARQFLGPWVEELMVYLDPERVTVKGLGLEQLPAFVHIDQNNGVAGAAEGWDPAQWRDLATELARVMSWRRPNIPDAGDPRPYAGSPALG